MGARPCLHGTEDSMVGSRQRTPEGYLEEETAGQIPRRRGAEEKGRRALQAKKEKAWGFTERPEHPRVRSAQLLILKALQISRNAPQSSWAPWMGDTGVLATLVGRCFPIVSSPKSNLSAKLRE